MKTYSLILFSLTYITIGIIGLFTIDLTWHVFVFWLIFAFGNGTIGHRYFAHDQFKVGKIKHFIFAIWCTISAYSPIVYWKVQHLHHHRFSDSDKDIHSPRNGLINSLFLWPFKKNKIESIFKDRSSVILLHKLYRDNVSRIFSDYFILINVAFLSILYFIGLEFVLFAAIAFLFEHLRLGLINTITHITSFPGNYRNTNTADNSHNNLFLGLIFLGFGWHNNHHANPKKLILTEKWWEIDLEGILGKLLSNRASR